MNIKKKRTEANLTQKDIADAFYVSQATVAKWETGETKPRADKLPDLAKILGCTIDELFEEE